LTTPLEETYDDVRKMAEQFMGVYGAYIDEADAAAAFDDAFLEAYHGGWDPDRKCLFSTWVRSKAHFKVMDMRKTLSRRPKLETAVDIGLEDTILVEEDEGPTIYDVITKGDARRILDYVSANRDRLLNQPLNKTTTRACRQEIRGYLRGGFGWKGPRIEAAMSEIRKLLERNNYLESETTPATTLPG